MKLVFRSSVVQEALSWVIWGYMSLVSHTIRWTIEGDEDLIKEWASKERGLVFASWHSRIFLLPVGWQKTKSKLGTDRGRPGILISLSRDGEFVARAAEKLGLKIVRGSAGNKKKKTKDKGGAAAIKEASGILENKGAICITVDGPRGPRQRATSGAALLAMRKQAAVICYAQATHPSIKMKSWDRFVVPFPFTKGTIIFGPVIDAARDKTSEQVRMEIEDGLNKATERAEALCGGTFEPPAPLSPTTELK